MQDLTGQTIGRYHIIEKLGEGGMAVVYKAYDTTLECDVAVKVIRIDDLPPSSTERTLKRFKREAKETAQLLHPNIVQVKDYGEYFGIPYLVMPFVPGGTLKDQQHTGQVMSFNAAARLLVPVARALEYAHKKGIIHRDIKPANILITESGQPLLTDFGVAKILDFEHTTQLTGMGMAIGTPEYMAPEQWLGKVTPQTDIYSLGIVFYELVTGRLPYTADTPAAIMLKQATEPLPRPNELVLGLPEKVEHVIFKVLARNAEDRYIDMNSFAAALEGLIGEQSEFAIEQSTNIQAVGVTPSSIETKTSEDLELGRESSILAEIGKKNYGTTNHFATKVRNQKLPGWLIGLGCVVILLIIYFAYIKNQPSQKAAFLSLEETSTTIKKSTSAPSSDKPALTPSENSTQTTANSELALGSNQFREKDGMKMVFVPPGPFKMGSDVGSIDEKPAHTITLDGYWIDSTEVTNKMYESCVKIGGCFAPRENSSSKHKNYYSNFEYDNYPVVYVDWKQANTYCEWAGGRLPSEAEWEKAARGTDGRTYPWGENEPDRTFLNYNNNEGDTSKVGLYDSGKNLYGAYDMAGNVWEWVADWYNNYPQGDSGSSGDFGEKYRVLRGGSWSLKDTYARSASRRGGYPSGADSSIGFRCAGSIENSNNDIKISQGKTIINQDLFNNLISQSQVLFEDNFDDLNNKNWEDWGGTTKKEIKNNLMVFHGDLKEIPSIHRHPPLTKNEGMLINYKISKNSEIQVKLTSGEYLTPSWRDFGIEIRPENGLQITKSNGVNYSGGQRLEGNIHFNPDKWFTVFLFITDTDGLYARVWETANPDYFAEYAFGLDKDWANLDWGIQILSDTGEVEFDSYKEIRVN